MISAMLPFYSESNDVWIALAHAQAAGPFSLQLRPQYTFSWNVSAAGVLHADMSTNESGWIGFGLSPTSFFTFHGMK